MKKLLLTAATDKEIEIFRNLQSEKYKLKYLVTGIGSDANQTISQKKDWLSKEFEVIINIGLCGSLLKEYQKGQLLVPSKVYFDKNSQNIAIPIANMKNLDNYTPVPFLTVSKPVDKIKRKQRLQRAYPEVVGIDMELYFWSLFTYTVGVDFMALKIISDFCEGQDTREIRQATPGLMQGAKKIINNRI